jgi:hypothetical protein
LTYQWNADGVAIAGATASTYTLAATDVGQAITVTASYTDGEGTAETVTSLPTGNVEPAPVPTISSTIDNVTNFNVSSNLVFTLSEEVTVTTGATVTIVNDGGAGYRGENTVHTQVITLTAGMLDATGTILTINPDFDLDLSNNYHVMFSDGAFDSVATPGNVSAATADATVFNFSTVTPGTHGIGTVATEAVASQAMDADGNLIASSSWLDVQNIGNNTGSVTQLGDLSGGAYTLVFKNYALVPGGPTGDSTDGVAAYDTNVGVINFGEDDLLYIDGQANDPAVQLFNAAYTAVVDGSPGGSVSGGIAGQNLLSFGVAISDPSQNGSQAYILLGLEGNTTGIIYPDIPSFATDWHNTTAPVIMG